MRSFYLVVGGWAYSHERPAARIVGGYEAQPFLHRYVVAIYEDGSSKCGGSLVRANAVVTAAHCVEGADAGYRFKVNRHNLTMSDSDELKQRMQINHSGDLGECLTFKAKKILRYPNYYRTEDYAKYDIALIILNRQSAVQGILLDAPHAYHTGKLAILVGWGRPRSGIPKPSPVLMETQIPVAEQHHCEVCQASLVQERIEFCAGFPEGTIDASRGDSGGPLFINSERGPVLIGFPSWTWPREKGYCPTVYVRISSFYNWIIDNLP
ncbi:Ovochymase-2 [Entomophthora muscae]|uniref:Ovochymase-2 n=1 Tax=Entomophthora muscae TaxID=34485 RepID=A0ACC2SR22_9FUNG|nr:Ovochymase-2 [Entomophthora muscae]